MIHYRSMTPADIPAAAAIEATVLDGWSADTIALTLACTANHCFVAVEQAGPESAYSDSIVAVHSSASAAPHALSPSETVCGFCACTLVGDTCNLDAVSVSESHRRRGVGRGLILHAMHTLHRAGAACMWLEARSENTPALSLYGALGFVQNGLRRGFYQNPHDDAVLMAALLQRAAE